MVLNLKEQGYSTWDGLHLTPLKSNLCGHSRQVHVYEKKIHENKIMENSILNKQINTGCFMT